MNKKLHLNGGGGGGLVVVGWALKSDWSGGKVFKTEELTLSGFSASCFFFLADVLQH